MPREPKNSVCVHSCGVAIRAYDLQNPSFCACFIQGTEVKAITYSAMQIHEDQKPEVFVIIDI